MLRLPLILLLILPIPAWGQDLAAQLASTLTAQQQGVFDFFRGPGGFRLTGGINTDTA